MTKTIACFAGALALVAGSALAQKTHSEKDSEVRQDRKEVKKDRRAVRADRHEVRQDRHDVGNAERRDDKKGAAAAGSNLDKSQAKLGRDEKELRKDTEELRRDQRQLRQ
jgi:hypothetical protein